MAWLTDLNSNERVSQPSMTVIVNQLESLGFAERRGDPEDGRVVKVAINRVGRQYLRTMRRAGALVFTTLIDKPAQADVIALREALPALRHLVGLSTDDGSGGGRPVESGTRSVSEQGSQRHRLRNLSLSSPANERSPR